MQKRKGVSLIVTGIFFIVIGVGLWIGGDVIDGNVERHMESIFNYGHRNSTGTIMINSGIGVMVIGAVLSLIGIVWYGTSGKSVAYSAPASDGNSSFVLHVGRFVSANGVYSVAFDNSGGCVWTQKGKHYKASYRKFTDTEWVISIDGFGNAFNFTRNGNDIVVVGGPVKEILYHTLSAVPGRYHQIRETKNCMNCGAVNYAGANYCSGCGGLLSNQNSQ